MYPDLDFKPFTQKDYDSLDSASRALVCERLRADVYFWIIGATNQNELKEKIRQNLMLAHFRRVYQQVTSHLSQVYPQGSKKNPPKVVKSMDVFLAPYIREVENAPEIWSAIAHGCLDALTKLESVLSGDGVIVEWLNQQETQMRIVASIRDMKSTLLLVGKRFSLEDRAQISEKAQGVLNQCPRGELYNSVRSIVAIFASSPAVTAVIGLPVVSRRHKL